MSVRVFLTCVLVACCAISVECKVTDYYKALGLRRDATDKQIKSAYRRLALKYHPDKIKEEEKKKAAQKQFIKISQAYEVLGDPKKKEAFDEHGIDPNDQDQQGDDGGFEGGFGGFPFGFDGGGGGGFEWFSGDGPGGPGFMFFDDDEHWGGEEQQNPNPFEDSDVVDLRWDEVPSSEVWAVMFYSPNEDSEEVVVPFKLFATAIKPYHINVGAIDCGMAEEFCMSQGFDLEEGGIRIRIYPMVRSRNKSVRHQKRGNSKPYAEPGYREIELSKRELFKWAIEYAPSYVTLVGGSHTQFDSFLAAEAKMHKVILFSDKDDVPGIFKALSVEFEGKLSFGKVGHKETQLLEIYGVEQLPHVIVQRDSSSDPVVYDGGMYRDEIRKFLKRFALAKRLPLTRDAPPVAEAGTCAAGQSCESPKLSQRAVHELRVPATEGVEEGPASVARPRAIFDDVCAAATVPVCAIVLLADDDSATEAQLARLEQLSASHAEYQFVWVGRADSAAFLHGFGAKFDDWWDEIPSIILYKPKRMRWAGFGGAWCCDDHGSAELRTFFDRLRLGDLPMQRLAQAPKLSVS